MKKYISITIVLVLILTAGFYLSRHRTIKPISPVIVTNTQQFNLPSGWEKVTDDKSSLKIIKKVSQGLSPQIVLINSSSKEATSSSKYVNNLIAGAKSAIPSLKITTDERQSSTNKYQANLSGFYYNQKQKISILQRISISGENISTLTASYTGNLAGEINQIFDLVSQN